MLSMISKFHHRHEAFPRYGPGDYHLAMDLVTKGKIHLKDLITHRYAFKDARAAFECMRDGKGYDGKAPIKCK